MLQAQVWERHLLNMAHEALEGDHGEHLEHTVPTEVYDLCADITRQHSKTFFMASNLLPDGKRQGAQALYAFCRVSDDLVDRPADGAQDARGSLLEAWRRDTASPRSITSHSFHSLIPISGLATTLDQKHAVSLAWADTRRAYQIPRGYADQLIDGLALDLNRTRYETFADLARYCYGVACTVGLMSMHIVGFAGREAIPYAIRLGVALQLTNILRDVGEDWRAGRLYLPLEELREYGLNEEDVAKGVVDNRWRAFMRFQIGRARTLYEEALPGVAMLHPDGRFAIAAAGELYRAILDKIEANDYNVFSKRASVSAWGKLRKLPGIWWRAWRAKV